MYKSPNIRHGQDRSQDRYERCGEVTSMIENIERSHLSPKAEALREYQSHNLTLTLTHQSKTAKAAQLGKECQTVVNEQSEP